MRMRRNQRAQRALSIFFLIIFLQSVIPPYYAYALTTGPHQVEYTSYDEPGATDMVNLVTGDFSFSLPILEVPGPEGNFSLPLTYNAGIGLDQEASWVGLGWSINAGAITRAINAFPDDSDGQSQNVAVKDLTGLRGWDASIFGVGKFGWNNNQGHFGKLSLLGIVNASWTDNYSSVGLMGINVTSDGMQVDGLQVAMGLMSLASMGTAASAVNAGREAAVAAGKQAAIGMAVGAATDVIMTGLTGMGTSQAPAGYWAYKNKTTNLGVYKRYKIWLDKTRNEKMYGILYLGNAPTSAYTQPSSNISLSLETNNSPQTIYRFPRSSETSNEGAASDIHYQTDINEELKDFSEVNNPVFLAYDNFHVKAMGISGSISPYRLDMGAVSMPREMTKFHDRLALVRYLPNDNAASAYKVPFIYPGLTSNAYFHHAGGSASVDAPSFNFGIQTSKPTAGQLLIDVDDVTLSSQRIKPALATLKKIPQANNIEWLTVGQIGISVKDPSGYMDYLSAGSTFSTNSDRYNFRMKPGIGSTSIYTETTSFNRSSVPVSSEDIGKISVNDIADISFSTYGSTSERDQVNVLDYVEVKNVQVSGKTTSSISFQDHAGFNSVVNGKIADILIKVRKGTPSTSSIGGFSITAVDGSTYHFALPVYEYDQYTKVRLISDPDNNTSVIKRNEAFANAWVLTGVTGSDFIDRNNNGMIDEEDWGYWVKLNYATHINDYAWRLPYEANSYKKVSNTHESYMEGKKQLLYLNSIETRSHVALFVKDVRYDGRSADPAVNHYPLQLSEIILLAKEDYKTLTKSTSEGGFGLPSLSNQLDFVLKSASLSSANTFLANECIKRVKFDYSYDLCAGTLNTTPNSEGTGKLTLNSVSIRGKGDLRIIPDYKFYYDYDPPYDKDKWDNWGMYNPDGTHTFTNPTPASDLNGQAWSLTKIKTPLGSDIEVKYERDSYTTISGEPTLQAMESSVIPQTNYYQLPKGVKVTNAEAYLNGEIVYLSGYLNYQCPGGTQMTSTINNYFTINNINTTTGDLEFAGNFSGIDCNLQSGQYVVISGNISVSKRHVKRYGGNLRVSTITVKDFAGSEIKTRYLYSAGTVSKETDQLDAFPARFNTAQICVGYPATPVLYGTVQVLQGRLTTDADFHTAYVYEFETPKSSHYNFDPNEIEENEPIYSNGQYQDLLTIYENKISDKSSQIGRLNSIRVLDQGGNTYSSSYLTYSSETAPILNKTETGSENQYQGYFTDGALMVDRVAIEDFEPFLSLKINRTTVIHHPNELVKVVNMKDGFTSETVNKSWDFLTGIVTEKLNKSPLGIYTKSVMEPAYTIAEYANMGSKSENVDNKNMLIQAAAEYVYKSDATGNTSGLISANIQTWKSAWDYDATQRYHSGDDGLPVWRKAQSYVWKGSIGRLLADGSQSFSETDRFVFGQSPSSNWQMTGEAEIYDHFSASLQVKDMNGIFSTSKMGYNETLLTAAASNAAYEEIAYSGAEDLLTTPAGYFGGDVWKGTSATVVNTPVHTGSSALSVASGTGFLFRSNGIRANKTYRASVWASNQNARIYFNINGTETTPAPVFSTGVLKQDGTTWYKADIDIPVGNISVTFFEVGVKSASGTVVLDDFRFQPVQSSMACYVYDAATMQPTFVLDNNNMFTRYEYNDRGLLVKTYQESVAYGEKLISQVNDNYRRFHIDQ